LVATLFCQLGSVNSLRDITNRLTASEGKLRHMGLPSAPKRILRGSLLSLLEIARGQAQQFGVRHKFRFKNKLLSINAATIELCASVFNWRSSAAPRYQGCRQAASDA